MKASISKFSSGIKPDRSSRPVRFGFSIISY